jgi:hypothetical protein
VPNCICVTEGRIRQRPLIEVSRTEKTARSSQQNSHIEYFHTGPQIWNPTYKIYPRLNKDMHNVNDIETSIYYLFNSYSNVITFSTQFLCNWPNDRSQWPRVGLRQLAYCDRGFESHRGHGCLSVVSVVCCQVEVSATS